MTYEQLCPYRPGLDIEICTAYAFYLLNEFMAAHPLIRALTLLLGLAVSLIVVIVSWELIRLRLFGAPTIYFDPDHEDQMAARRHTAKVFGDILRKRFSVEYDLICIEFGYICYRVISSPVQSDTELSLCLQRPVSIKAKARWIIVNDLYFRPQPQPTLYSDQTR